MPDKYLKDLPLVTTPTLADKIPVSQVAGTEDLAITPAHIIGLHTAETDPHSQYATAEDISVAVAAITATDVNADPAGTAAGLITDLVGASPETLNQISELATAIGDDPNFAVTVAAGIAERIPKSLATAASQFLLSSGAGAWVVKTVAEIVAVLGLKGAAFKDVGTGANDVMAGNTTIPAAQVQSDWNASSGLSQIANKPTLLTIGATSTTAMAGDTPVLTPLANTNTQSGTTYTIVTTDIGKDVRFTSATAVTLTLPAYTGFLEGFQCTLHNDSANAIDVTISGTVVASGTKIAQKKSVLLRMVGSSWRASGGLS